MNIAPNHYKAQLHRISRHLLMDCRDLALVISSPRQAALPMLTLDKRNIFGRPVRSMQQVIVLPTAPAEASQRHCICRLQSWMSWTNG